MAAPTLIQVFGLDNDSATRAAQRFFKERRLAFSFIDLRRRAIAPAELRRFTQRLGAAALLDTGGAAYRDAGLGYMRLSDEEVTDRLLADVRLLRLPLVRFGDEVSVGRDEATWKRWIAAAR